MNKLTIIGNVTKDPEHRTTREGVPLCSFTVAVNRKGRDGQQEADFFRVTAWRQLGDICARYLLKGRKVCVIGPVSARAYQGNDGNARVSLEMTAEEVEFLSPKGEQTEPPKPPVQEYLDVGEDDLPF